MAMWLLFPRTTIEGNSVLCLLLYSVKLLKTKRPFSPTLVKNGSILWSANPGMDKERINGVSQSFPTPDGSVLTKQ